MTSTGGGAGCVRGGGGVAGGGGAAQGMKNRTRSHRSMKSMAGCVGGLGKGNVCGAGRADGRGAGAWVVEVRAEGSRGARTHGSMRGMGGGAGCVRGKG